MFRLRLEANAADRERDHAFELEKQKSESAGGSEGASQVWSSLSVLDFSVKLRISPLQLRKVGAVIQQMQAAEYSDEQINDVCRALFLDQSEEDMAVAWKVFDHAEMGYLDGDEFKKALPLLGENVPPGEIDSLFKEVDTDGSGMIEFPEFCIMVRRMNPKEGAEAEGAAEPPTTEVAEEEPAPELAELENLLAEPGQQDQG